MLEVASENTGLDDYTEKRLDYANFGIPEYWRFDPSGGQYHDTHMAGDRLLEGVYHSVSIIRTDETHYWGHSDVLNLDLCWENGRLRWWDPAALRYLETHDEEADGRIAERAGRLSAEAERDGENQARIAAEAERDGENQARIAAEAERDGENQARIAAEAERDRENQARIATEARLRALEAELDRRQRC